MIPAPPDVARQLPEFFLRRRNEAIEGARFADDGRDLAGGFSQHADFVLAKDARLFGLDDQHALQHAAIDEGHAEEGVIFLFAGFFEVFVARMIA